MSQSKKVQLFSVRVPIEEYKAMQTIAEKKDLSVNQIVRAFFRDYIKENKKLLEA